MDFHLPCSQKISSKLLSLNRIPLQVQIHKMIFHKLANPAAPMLE